MAEEKWKNSAEFILTIIGYAVGLGNVWRFPYLVYDNGGLTYVIVFFIMLFVIGIPMFFLELAVGQFSGLGPTRVYYKMAPIFQGLGYAAITANSFVALYYNVLIAYCIYYLILSMRGTLPWADCSHSWNTDACVVRNFSINCTEFNQMYPNLTKSPSEEFFYDEFLKISGGIGELGKIQYPIALCLLAAWAIVFIVLSKGVKSLGKVSYFTATFPYIMLTVLVISGAILPSAGKGVEYYIGKIDWKKFGDANVWKDAAVQVFFSLSVASGGLIAMSSFNNFKNNLLTGTFLIPILAALTGVYAGFAIFTVLGYMVESKCRQNDFKSVVAGGPQLAFIVYPEGLSLIKAVPPLWSILFFLMMLALGFGSEFSIMEANIGMIMYLFQKYIKNNMHKILTRLTVCTVYFLIGLFMTTKGGFYILSLINEYAASYPRLMVGLLETIVVPWVYGVNNFIRDIECMIGKKPDWFWWIWRILWSGVTPIALLSITIANAVTGNTTLTIYGKKYPDWATAIGWIIVAIPFFIVIGCAIAQMILYNFNFRRLLSPDPSFYDNRNRYLQEEKQKQEQPINVTRVGSNGNINKVAPMPNDDKTAIEMSIVH